MVPLGHVPLERLAKERRKRLHERRSARVVEELEPAVGEKLADRVAREEAQVGAVPDPRPRIPLNPEERPDAVVPNAVVRHGDDPLRVPERLGGGERAEEGDRVGDVLEHVGQNDDVDRLALLLLQPVLEHPGEDLVARARRELRGPGVRLNPDDVRMRRPLLELAVVGAAAAADVEDARALVLGRDVLLVERLDRRVRPLDVRVGRPLHVERVRLAGVRGVTGDRLGGAVRGSLHLAVPVPLRVRLGLHAPKTSRATCLTASSTASSDVWRTRKPSAASLSGFSARLGDVPRPPLRAVLPNSIRARLLCGDAATQSSAIRVTLVQSGGARL